MATSTGKKARQKHGTKVAAKRAKARKPKRRTFGKLAYSVVAKNADGAVAANERTVMLMAEARRAKGFDQGDNVAVTPSMPTRAQVDEVREKIRREMKKQRRAIEVYDEEDYE